MSTSPEFLGPYRIGNVLGRGGMGAVYEGVHERSGEKVAVKLISQSIGDEPRFRRRFAGEVETLKRLKHPGIVRLVGYGEENGQLFYSMELVEGEPLQAMIRREKRLTWETTIDLSIQVCAALKHAHDFGVIHRDLKPANLILTPDHQVKLVDFGIAKLFGFGEQTMAGSVLGTADYMAPEQADGDGVTVRTDLYALGSVMYAMLTGKPPFNNKSITQVIKSLRNDKPVRLDRINEDLPIALVELVHQLLEKDSRDRPPTALSVMNRLKAMRAGLKHQQTLNGKQLGTHHSLANETGESDSAIEDARTPIAGSENGTISKTVATVNSRNTDATVGTAARGKDETEFEIKEPSTHFQTVDAEEERSRHAAKGHSAEAERWRHAISVCAMGAALVACAILFFKALEKPTADELYQSIVQQTESGDLQEAVDEIGQFLRQFPEDPRAAEVTQFDRAIELKRTLRRLGVQNKLGITPLSAAEQGFLDAMTGREQDPQTAIERLRQWLAIYDADTIQTNEAMNSMILLASNEIEQLRERYPEVLIDSRAQELIERVDTALEKMPMEKARSVLEGIIELHRDQEWAAPAVEAARQGLDSL
ncbi:Serine/threonine-protein kinase PknA [Novipirellula aureliae]|uniref:non-specific serine/threonine protein kinase n=1 Tax=Novipirellula aureliae TaxID=2527966 RepID=A0A5C6DQH9_9BACT|nr:serine/threonine-protein kinase [Novipirellula aureliae]TWU39008.1 Serine/threonine-protein kinase PknA [Novipirellula aureliae]